MPWTAPKTFVTGEIMTAPMFNAQGRDNLLETMPGKADAAGSIFQAVAANSISALPVGVAGQFLQVDAGATAVKWGSETRNLNRSTSQVDVVSTTTETSIYSFSIPANELGVNGGAMLTTAGDFLQNTASGGVTLRVKLGSTTVLTSTNMTPAQDTDRNKWWMIVWFILVSASSQKWNAFMGYARNADNWSLATAWFGLAGQGASSEDMTSAQTINITAQPSQSSTNLSFRKEEAALLEI